MSNIHLELLQLAQDKNSDANPSYLLSQGANPNYRDKENHKWTPLHYAVMQNKENFALQLLSHPRTNALLLDSDGFSALYWASKKSTSRMVSALLSKGCCPNERDIHGMTALFAAVASNKTENVKILLSHPSINVNQVNQFGGSALHHTAFATDNVELADILVRAGANLFLIDREQQYPLHVAKRRKREKLWTYFKQKMLLDSPNWKCDITFLDNNGYTSPDETTSPDDCDEHVHNHECKSTATPIQSAINNSNSNHSNVSTESGFSRQSSENSSDHNINYNINYNEKQTPKISHYKTADYIKQHKSNKNKKKQKHKPSHSQSHSRKIYENKLYNNNNYDNSYESINNHQLKMKQLQENKLKIAVKIDQSALNKEARDLLQEQQYYFQYEQEVFYSSMQNQFSSLKREMDQLRHQNLKLIKQNNELQHQNIKLNMAFTYQPIPSHLYNNNNNNKKSMNKKISKHGKEFKKWFKNEIGSDFMQYYACFVNNGFDDLRTVRHITHEQELKELGIDKKGHRLHILHKIDEYKNNNIALPALPAFVAAASSPINTSIDVDDCEGDFKTE